ncbi:MAG: hypothetical protein ABH813_00505 [Patescibacteria group bacterium]
MKGFIVDDMSKETAGGSSVAELEAFVKALMLKLKDLDLESERLKTKNSLGP